MYKKNHRLHLIARKKIGTRVWLLSTIIISWNMRGTKNREKSMIMRKKTRQFKPTVMAIQETKLYTISECFIKHIWENMSCNWNFIPLFPSIGASGVILTIWDDKTLESVASI